MKHVDGCALCARMQACEDGTEPNFIAEFKHSFLLLGDHQYFKGYCVLVTKDHARDMMDLPGRLQLEVMQEMLFASRAVQLACKPWKLNHASLGNQTQHIHWHIFPRYEDDPDLKQHPWLNQDRFSAHVPSADEAKAMIERIRDQIEQAGLY